MGCSLTERERWSLWDRREPWLWDHAQECEDCRRCVAEMEADARNIADAFTTHPTELPSEIGPYRTDGILGEGAQGVVCRAVHVPTGRLVALKILRRGFPVHRFEREFRTLAKLNHPAIATLYETGHSELGQPFFAMEFVPGVELDAYVHDNDIPLPQRLELFCKICDAVQYAHDQGVVHRDLKPSNILVTASAQPKILDFGLAHLVQTDANQTQTLTQSGQVLGTLRYMSPEQARGNQDQIDKRTDVYSLGVILYELLTDQSPYECSSNLLQAADTICNIPPRRPSSIRKGLSGDLQRIVLQALEKDRVLRHASVAELARDVRAYLAGKPLPGRRRHHGYVIWRTVLRHRVAGSVLLALLLLTSVGAYRWRYEQQQSLLSARHNVLVIVRDLDAGRENIRFAEAQAAFERTPNLPETTLVWARAQFEKGVREGDHELCNSAIGTLRNAPSDLCPWAIKLLRAEFYQAQRNPLADQFRAEGERAAPDTAEAWYLRSIATLDRVAAQHCAETAVERDPHHRLAWERLANLALRNGDYTRARTATEKMIEFTSGDLGWIMFLVCINGLEGRDGETRPCCERVAFARPATADDMRQRALARLCLKDYAGVVDDCTRALSTKQDCAQWDYYRRATPRWILGDHAGAAADYRSVRTYQSYMSYATARLFLVLMEHSRLLRDAGQTTQAAEAAQEARQVLDSGIGAAGGTGWLAKVFACLDGQVSPDALVQAADPRDRAATCEACYYAGERCLLDGDRAAARAWFEKGQATHLLCDPHEFPPGPMNEYHLSVWRLDQLVTSAAPMTSATDP